MRRKMLGVFTAVAAALLLVGVAWASGDRDDAGSGSVAVAAGSDVSSSGSAAIGRTGPTVVDSTPTSVEDGTSTSVRLVDTSSTSTTVDSSTSTSLDEGPTSTSVGDDQSVAITTEPRTYDVDAAGTVSIQVVAGRLVLLDVAAASGWSVEIEKADSRDIEVAFENADSEAEFEAKIRDHELRIEIERE